MSISIVYDIETLSTSERAVILSLAAVKVDFSVDFEFEDLINSAVYIKFDSKDQVTRLGRVVDPDTLAWWKQQDPEVRAAQMNPASIDLKLEDGIEELRKWFARQGFDKRSSTLFTRGELDHIVTQDILKQLKVEPIYPFWRVRDIRTAVDCLYGSTNGYCATSKQVPSYAKKHNPIYDCAIDALMLKYGIES